MENTADRKSLIATSAAEFAEWLNASNSKTAAIAGDTTLARFWRDSSAKDFARDRIRPLVELILDFRRDFQKQKKRSARFETFEKYQGKVDPLLTGIAKLYPIQPVLSDATFGTGIPMFADEPIPPKGGREPIFTQAYQNGLELTARLNQFFRLASEDAFAAFRRCALPSWGSTFTRCGPRALLLEGMSAKSVHGTSATGKEERGRPKGLLLHAQGTGFGKGQNDERG